LTSIILYPIIPAMSLHEEPGKVYWADLQQELGATGLDISVGFPTRDWWPCLIDGQKALLDVDARDPSSGRRNSMTVCLTGQSEITVLPKLSQFMGYEPFVRYRWEDVPEVSAVYEWNATPDARISQVVMTPDFSDVQRLDAGFTMPERKMDELFQQVASDLIAKLEQAVEKNPDVGFADKPLKPFLPFLREVMPRVARTQSLFGLSLISLDFKPADEESVVKYALEPLLKTGILTEDDQREIVAWFKLSQPRWEPDPSKHYMFSKVVEVGGQKYTIVTDNYRDFRDLNVLEGDSDMSTREGLMRFIQDHLS